MKWVLKLLGRVAGTTLRWVGFALKLTMKWAAAHPWLAIGASVALYVGGNWLSEQRWAGAHMLGEVARVFGVASLGAGLGGFVWKPLGRFLGRGAAVGYAGRGLPFQPYTTVGLAFMLTFLTQGSVAAIAPADLPMSFDSFLDTLM